MKESGVREIYVEDIAAVIQWWARLRYVKHAIPPQGGFRLVMSAVLLMNALNSLDLVVFNHRQNLQPQMAVRNTMT